MTKRKERVVLLYATSGNDLCYMVPAYIMQQHERFEEINFGWIVCGFQASHSDALRELLRSGYEFDYVHIMDSDVVPREDTTERLVSHGLDLVASPVWMYTPSDNDLHLNVHFEDQGLRIKSMGTGIEKCHSVSFSSIVISRRVLQSFIMAEEDFTTDSPLLSDLPYMSRVPDQIFFAKARKLGFELWIDWDCKDATHYRRVHLNQDTINKAMIVHGKDGCVDPRFYPDHPAFKGLAQRAPHVAAPIQSNWQERSVVKRDGETFREVTAGLPGYPG